MNKNVNSCGALHGSRFAIRQADFERLASVSLNFELKDNGAITTKNVIELRADGVAVVKVDGALCYRDGIASALFGFDTYESIENALDDVLKDDAVKGVILDFNSPGGEVSGVSDLAEKIYNSRSIKPIYARTGGVMCSAAYWLASACEKVFTAENGTLGSIGVMCAFNDSADGVSVITSDLSPDKNASPTTAAGLALVKKELNALASVFIDAVAKYRNTTAANVRDNYGRGGVFIGADAVRAGLADGVESLESVCKMVTGESPRSSSPVPAGKASANSRAAFYQALNGSGKSPSAQKVRQVVAGRTPGPVLLDLK